MARSFNKAATTIGFLKKVLIAQNIIKTFEPIEGILNKPYYQRGIYKDKERNVFLDVYIGKKVKGIGKLRVNECSIHFSSKHHPELGFKHLTKNDLKVYSPKTT